MPVDYPSEKYKSKEWLQREYVDLKRSTKEMGAECDVSASCIVKWLNKSDIPVRGGMSGDRKSKDRSFVKKTKEYHSEDKKAARVALSISNVKKRAEKSQAKASSNIGKRFGRITIVSVMFGGNFTRCKYRCDCGTESETTIQHVLRGKTTQCRYCSAAPEDPLGQEIKYYHHQCVKSRGLSWGLSREQFEFLVSRDCYYCGKEPSNRGRLFRGPKRSGIDRVDSSIGYEPGNCVPCCKECNIAKSNKPAADFLRWAIRVVSKLEAQGIRELIEKEDLRQSLDCVTESPELNNREDLLKILREL